MQSKIVFQFNQAGLFVHKAIADESPREPGIFLIPAYCTETPVPESWSDDVWPRFNGSNWELIPKPKIEVMISPEEKLAEFLAQNPDVMSLINAK
ncbi:phage tail protein [Acinetobacter junii]|uniref:phage tail protein n=1 Tax=Acinetobacter junii TaxID=40215 RepID=UPI003213449B